MRELVKQTRLPIMGSEIDQGYGGSLDIIFRGNDKFNFTSRLKDKDIIILCETLNESGDLIRHIDLSYNHISDTGAESLAQLISNCPYLESLNLQGNDIETAGS